MEKDEQSASGPDAIARRVGQLAVSRRRPSSILIGPFIQRLAVLLRVLLPRRVFDWGLGKILRPLIALKRQSLSSV